MLVLFACLVEGAAEIQFVDQRADVNIEYVVPAHQMITICWRSHRMAAGSWATSTPPRCPRRIVNRLVDRFTRAATTSTHGSSFGLYIAQRLAESNNGHISYQPATPPAPVPSSPFRRKASPPRRLHTHIHQPQHEEYGASTDLPHCDDEATGCARPIRLSG